MPANERPFGRRASLGLGLVALAAVAHSDPAAADICNYCAGPDVSFASDMTGPAAWSDLGAVFARRSSVVVFSDAPFSQPEPTILVYSAYGRPQSFTLSNLEGCSSDPTLGADATLTTRHYALPTDRMRLEADLRADGAPSSAAQMLMGRDVYRLSLEVPDSGYHAITRLGSTDAALAAVGMGRAQYLDGGPGRIRACSPSDMPIAPAEMQIFDEQREWFLALGRHSSEVTRVDFDRYPNGAPVPTGQDDTGRPSGFVLSGQEWSSLGVSVISLAGAPLNTITEAKGHSLAVSMPNGLSPGDAPIVGQDDNADAIEIRFDHGVRAFGLTVIESSPSGGENIRFLAADGTEIPHSGIAIDDGFFGVIAPRPFRRVLIEENANDSDDVAYDDLLFWP